MKLKTTLAIWLGGLIILFVIVLGLLVINDKRQSITTNLIHNQNALAEQIQTALVITDTLLTDQVKGSMRLLLERIGQAGEISLGEPVSVGSKQVPNLMIGGQAQANHYELVDNLTKLVGGTATLFVRDGNDFVRISTNIIRDSQRATGTLLNASGKAYQAILKGQAFYGNVDILGLPYITAYEPLKNAQGKVIGIAYTGYKADMERVSQLVGNARLLSDGFAAVEDQTGVIRMHSSHMDSDQVSQLLAHKSTDWQIHNQSFEKWGYNIYVAYSNQELHGLLLKEIVKISLAGLISGALLLTLLSFLIGKLVLTPIVQVQSALNKLVDGDGDLTVRLNIQRQDEIGTMASSFDRMLERLNKTVLSLAERSDTLRSLSQELLGSSSETLKKSQFQSREISNIATSVHEVSMTANSVSHSAQAAELQTRKINDLNGELNQVLEDTIKNSEQQLVAMNDSRQALTVLEEASRNIVRVLDVINAIADQTNLLALNAAIEAARAGAHGRGFSVVADEVRSLASRTQSSTNEIKQMITSLEEGVGQVINLNDRYKNTIESNFSLVSTANAKLSDIRTSIDTIQLQNSEIASATEQQSVVTEEINKTAELIRLAAEQNEQLARVTQQRSEKAKTSTEQMVGEINLYRY